VAPLIRIIRIAHGSPGTAGVPPAVVPARWIGSKAAALRFAMTIILLSLVLLDGLSLRADASASKEYQVKAVFLFHFTEFVDWPSKSFPLETTPIVIGVLGEDPFGTYLDEVVRNEKVKNRSLVVQRYRKLEDIKLCHVLYVSAAEADHVEEISASLRARGILTVGETVEFVRSGGMVGFATGNGRLHLIINLEAAKAADLTISSKLLRSAEIVGSRRD
jgi:YfiR/HmsC-like